MDIVIYIFMTLIFLAEIIFFKGYILALLLAGIVCVVYIIYRTFVKKRLPKVAGYIGCWVILLIFAICLFKTGKKGEEGSFIVYTEDVNRVCDYISDNEYGRASELIENMKEEYGNSDTTTLLMTISHLSAGELEKAKETYKKVLDKSSQISIAVEEQIYMQDAENLDLVYLEKFYREAANKYPQWEYIQLRTGIVKIDLKQYRSAMYYLYNAYAMNEENPQTLYFLGVSNFETGNEEDALFFFNEAVRCGIDDTTKSYIKGYLDEMNYWGEENVNE